MQGVESNKPGDEIVTLTAGDYEAGISVGGATLRWLTYKGEDLVLPNSKDRFDYPKAYWPHFQTSFDQGSFGCAVFCVSSRSADSVLMMHSLMDHDLSFEVMYNLGETSGLEAWVICRNYGEQIARYDVCEYPYVVAGPEPMTEWTVEVPHSWVERPGLRPWGELEGCQLESGVAIKGLDVYFDSSGLDRDGRWRVTVTSPSGSRVEVSAPQCSPWVVLFARQWDESPEKRRHGLAIQPRAHYDYASNLFPRENEQISLYPGERHEVEWRIRSIGLAPAYEDEDKPPRVQFRVKV